MWWQSPIITATWEAEAEESFEPRRQRLQGAKITPLHFKPEQGSKTLSKKKKEKKRKEKSYSSLSETTVTGLNSQLGTIGENELKRVIMRSIKA